MGNLTRDPEVKYIASGQAVCEVGLAVNRTWWDKQANVKKEDVTFVDVTLWGREAEVAGEYLAKGRPVLIEGRLQLDSWDDKATGQKRSKLRVVGEHMQMLGSRADGPGAGGQSGQSGQSGGGSRPAARSTAPPRDSDSQYGDAPGPSQSYDSGPPSGGDDVPF